jgi:uncharacterized protein (DUF2236 family)
MSEEYYFPPGESMARRVHGDRAVGLLYGQRALLIGALEPLTYTGTMLSTKSGDRPFTRLARTARIQEMVLLGTREEADAALAGVRRVHHRINGTLPEAAGPHPAGTTYSALDPKLMLWTLAVIADSAREVYETMVRRLSDGEREALWRDYVRFGELFGLPAAEVPGSHREFREWWAERLASPELQATPHALEMAPLCAFEQPVPTAARANIALQNLVVKGTLPPRVREIYEIAWSPAQEAAFRSVAAGHRRARRLFPRPLRRGRNDVFFDAVTRAEKLRGGTETPKLDLGGGAAPKLDPAGP